MKPCLATLVVLREAFDCDMPAGHDYPHLSRVLNATWRDDHPMSARRASRLPPTEQESSHERAVPAM